MDLTLSEVLVFCQKFTSEEKVIVARYLAMDAVENGFPLDKFIFEMNEFIAAEIDRKDRVIENKQMAIRDAIDNEHYRKTGKRWTDSYLSHNIRICKEYFTKGNSHGDEFFIKFLKEVIRRRSTIDWQWAEDNNHADYLKLLYAKIDAGDYKKELGNSK